MKKDFTISENYILPSLGKIYEEEFDPHITIRSMTTADEMKRLSPSELTYKNMCSEAGGTTLMLTLYTDSSAAEHRKKQSDEDGNGCYISQRI